MKTKPVELPEGNLEVWCHLSPFGTFPGMQGDTRVEQVIDLQACAALIAAFTPEVLVDYEHRAHNSDDTSAAGWVQELETREDGLYARIRFTDRGAEDIRGRRLRFLSPVWTLDDNGRPDVLKSVALTNTPNLKLRPILNKAPGGETTTKGTAHMKELAALFGLPDTATDAEILEAAKALKTNADAIEARLAELESASLNSEAEKVAEDEKDKIANKADFVALYVANKDFAVRLLATLKAPAPAATVCNKTDSKKPPFSFGPAVQNKLAQYEALPEGRDKVAFLRANAQEINTLRNARSAE